MVFKIIRRKVQINGSIFHEFLEHFLEILLFFYFYVNIKLLFMHFFQKEMIINVQALFLVYPPQFNDIAPQIPEK